MKAIFITGTDTGVGKTAISAGFCAFLSLKKGLDVGVMKPFETGLPKGRSPELSCDAKFLKEASGSQDILSEISPYTFEAPLAPETAARKENIIIDMDLVNAAYERLLGRHDILVVEGAGGVFVPIKKNFVFADLIKAWDIPVIIVARLGLGTINHTLLTHTFLQSRDIKVLGVILNDTGGVKDLAAETNPEILREYLDVPLFGVFPYAKAVLNGAMDRESLAETFAANIDAQAILDQLEA